MMSKTTAFASIAAACLFLGLAGCESADKTEAAAPASMGVVNSTCPIMAGRPVKSDTTTYVEYNGVKVGFCCTGCDTKWENLSDADKKAFIKQQTSR